VRSGNEIDDISEDVKEIKRVELMADMITTDEPFIHNKPRQPSHAKGEQTPTRYTVGCTLKMPTNPLNVPIHLPPPTHPPASVDQELPRIKRYYA
jgi:hypothetical protein